MGHADACQHIEQLAGDVTGGAVARGSKAHLAGIGLGKGDELGNRFGRKRRVHFHDVREATDESDWCDIADEIEVEFLIERRVGRVRRRSQQEGVAVGGRPHDRLGRDIGGVSRSAFDHKRPAGAIRKPLPDQTCDDVGPAASRKAMNDSHRPRRIALRPS